MKIRATRFAVVVALVAMGCGGPAQNSNLAPSGTVTGTTSAPSMVAPTTEGDEDDSSCEDQERTGQGCESRAEPSAARSGPALEVTTTSLKPIARDEDGVLIATHLFIRNVSRQSADAPLMRVRTHLLGDEGPIACALRSQHALGTLRDIRPGETRKIVALSVCERLDEAATAVGFVEFEDDGLEGAHFIGRVAVRPVAAAEAVDDPADSEAEAEGAES